MDFCTNRIAQIFMGCASPTCVLMTAEGSGALVPSRSITSTEIKSSVDDPTLMLMLGDACGAARLWSEKLKTSLVLFFILLERAITKDESDRSHWPVLYNTPSSPCSRMSRSEVCVAVPVNPVRVIFGSHATKMGLHECVCEVTHKHN